MLDPDCPTGGVRELNDIQHSSWQRLALIQRGLLVLLLGGVSLLLVEVRFEHQAVLGVKWQSWIPIIYLSSMLLLGALGIATFRRFGCYLLIGIFIGLAVVGLLGFWFHSKEKPIQKVAEIVSTDLSAPGHLKEQSDEDTNPPVLAPLALVGLGAIGVLACFLMPVKR